MKNIYEYDVVDIEGEKISLKKYQGKTLLIVNVASRCGFTPQYQELEELYKEHKQNAFEILAFPCNQFGSQEPGDSKEIKLFCSLNYQITFSLFEKVDVNGENAIPLFSYLKESLPGIMGSKAIKWNFTKFLVDKTGIPYKRYAPNDRPLTILNDLKKIT